MTTKQALGALLLAILLTTAGLTWQFGPYGLYGGAALIGLLVSFVNIEKGGGSA